MPALELMCWRLKPCEERCFPALDEMDSGRRHGPSDCGTPRTSSVHRQTSHRGGYDHALACPQKETTDTAMKRRVPHS